MTKRTMNEELQRLLPKPAVLVALLVAAVAFVSLYWSSIVHLVDMWRTQDDYGHGFFVPIFAVVLLWLRREMIATEAGRGNWWGLPVLAVWAGVLWAANYFHYGSLPEYSMLVFFTGIVIFVGGWRWLNWAWPSIVFLVFMIPLPGAVQGTFSLMLQGLATRMSVFTIQTLGIPPWRKATSSSWAMRPSWTSPRHAADCG